VRANSFAYFALASLKTAGISKRFCKDGANNPAAFAGINRSEITLSSTSTSFKGRNHKRNIHPVDFNVTLETSSVCLRNVDEVFNTFIDYAFNSTYGMVAVFTHAARIRSNI